MAHGGAVNCVQVGRKTGSVMVTGGSDNRVNVWAVGKPNAIMVRARVRRASAPPAAARRGVCRGVQSLSGHTSAVECVSFDSAEQTVIAGSSGGTLKMWDLEHGKVARTLTGHRCNCVSVQARAGRAHPRREPRRAPPSRPIAQWHPYGEFFASGSVDTNLKIWDIRKKSCIQTYRGHTKGVRQVRRRAPSLRDLQPRRTHLPP